MHAGAFALTLVLAGHSGLAQGPTDKDYFTVLGTGFAFVRPASWKVQNLKREQRVTIPTPAAHGPAIMHFYTVDWRYSTSDWQDTQVQVASELKRSVDRRWEEEILGIPLVLTKTSGVDAKGVPDVVLTGMFYSASKNKMLFRLTCPAEDFDVANKAWHDAFQTLRTTDGSKPSADDPSKKLTPDELAPKPSGPLPVTQLGGAGQMKKPVKGAVIVPGKAGGKNALIHLPSGWSAVAQKDGGWLVTGKTLTGQLTMSLASTLDSDPVSTALLKLSGASLSDFTQVKDRTDIDDQPNKAGGHVSAVFRSGTTAHGQLTSFEAAVTTGDLYVLFHWSSVGPLTGADRKALNELLAEVTVDTAP